MSNKGRPNVIFYMLKELWHDPPEGSSNSLIRLIVAKNYDFFYFFFICLFVYMMNSFRNSNIYVNNLVMMKKQQLSASFSECLHQHRLPQLSRASKLSRENRTVAGAPLGSQVARKTFQDNTAHLPQSARTACHDFHIPGNRCGHDFHMP